MNQSTAIFLINDKVRAIYVIYEPDTEKTSAPRTMFKTFDQSIKVDDLIVVPTGTRLGMTVVKVTQVDVRVDFDDATAIQWVCHKVDRHPYEVVLAREGDMMKVVREAEENHKREELRKKIFASTEAQVGTLAIATMTDITIEAEKV